MGKKENFKLVFLSYQELLDLNLHKINRCGHLTLEDALANNYTMYDFEKLQKRASRMLNDIKKRGYIEDSCISVATCIEDNKTYIIDGQTRRFAVIMGVKTNQLEYEPLPCHHLGYRTYAEISESIEQHNTSRSTPWKSVDKINSKALKYNGECQLIVDSMNKYRMKLFSGEKGTSNTYLMFLGQGFSKMINKPLPLEFKNLRKDYKLFTTLYERFINEFGNKSRLDKAVRDKVKNFGLASVWESFFNLIYQTCNTHGLNPETYMTNALNYLIKWSNRASSLDKLKEFMYIKDTDKMLFISSIGIETFLEKTFGNLKTTFGDTTSHVLLSFYRWANKGSELKEDADDDSMKENVI